MFDKNLDRFFEPTKNNASPSSFEEEMALALLCAIMDHAQPKDLETLGDQEFNNIWEKLVYFLGSIKGDLPDMEENCLEDFYLSFCTTLPSDTPNKFFFLVKQ